MNYPGSNWIGIGLRRTADHRMFCIKAIINAKIDCNFAWHDEAANIWHVLSLYPDGRIIFKAKVTAWQDFSHGNVVAKIDRMLVVG